MRRRAFITLLGGAVAPPSILWPIAARAQQPAKLPTIGFLGAATASAWGSWTAAFEQRLRELGWTEGRTVAIEYRWAEGRPERYAEIAAEFVGRKVDVIVTVASAVTAVKQVTSVIPIVFALAADPVGAGFVESLARPGANATGFLQFEYGMSTKWLELLKELAPGLRRAGVLRDTDIAAGAGQFGAIQAVAPSLGVEITPVGLRDTGEIERGVTSLARIDNSGLIVTASAAAIVHRELIVSLANRLKLPSVYFQRPFATAGGLISYGSDIVDQYRRAAAYVDRILKGEKPADLPVQAPTRYSLVINLKTAKALELTVPPTLLARADEVIE